MVDSSGPNLLSLLGPFPLQCDKSLSPEIFFQVSVNQLVCCAKAVICLVNHPLPLALLLQPFLWILSVIGYCLRF